MEFGELEEVQSQVPSFCSLILSRPLRIATKSLDVNLMSDQIPHLSNQLRRSLELPEIATGRGRAFRNSYTATIARRQDVTLRRPLVGSARVALPA